MSSRVSRLASLALAFLAFAAQAATNDLDVARQALRDGFWSLARAHAHAQAPVREDAKLIVLESLAHESKWTDILSLLSSWGSPSGDAFAYYRALALAKTGEVDAARAVFASGLPADPAYGRLSARLLADLALACGEPSLAVKAFAGFTDLESDDRLLLAEAQNRLGKPAAAAVLWRGVLSDTNASLRATVTAAANLGDAKTLRRAVSNAVPVEIRTQARLRLGCVLLNDPGGFEEGTALIQSTVAEYPDADGAFEASLSLASARLHRRDWAGAVTAYSEIREIWPKAARLGSVEEGLGWAYLKQGRAEEALQAFRSAEACATTDEERATAAAKAADALSALGRLDESTAQCRAVIAKWPNATVSKRLTEVVRMRELEAEGRRLYGEFRFADAQKLFHEVGKGDPLQQGRMAFFEALCLYGQGLDAEAETAARSLMRSTDDLHLRADVTLWLARAAYNGGRWREAKELFSAVASSELVAPADAASARVWAARAALAANDFSTAISLAAEVVASADVVSARAEAQLVQGEALLELARFDEAVLVFERAAAGSGADAKIRAEARIHRADSLYAMGADNPLRYEEALASYRAIIQQEKLPDEARLSLAYKIGITLEKLKRKTEAVDQYYTHVLLAYRDARQRGLRPSDEAQAVFSRAAFRLADLCERSGHFLQAQKTLELVVESAVPAAAEAQKRIDRLRTKGILP